MEKISNCPVKQASPNPPCQSKDDHVPSAEQTDRQQEVRADSTRQNQKRQLDP